MSRPSTRQGAGAEGQGVSDLTVLGVLFSSETESHCIAQACLKFAEICLLGAGIKDEGQHALIDLEGYVQGRVADRIRFVGYSEKFFFFLRQGFTI